MSEEYDPSKGAFLLYQTDDGQVRLNVRLEEETLWLTQGNMAELFQVKPQNITMHLKNIHAEEELVEDSTCKEFLQVQMEGRREVERLKEYSFFRESFLAQGARYLRN